MRLRHIHICHYRLHEELALEFASGLTVLHGRNESGKSTVAEAIHRALFVPARSGGVVVESMRPRPAKADPQLELQFSADGAEHLLCKRFAGPRGTVSLRTDPGTLLQADAAEQALSDLVGSAAVRGGNAARLKERWGHLWVWQGRAGDDPLGLSAEALDQTRLLHQLQSSSQYTVQSPLDQRVMAAVRQRWLASHTDTGRKVRAGSDLDRALKAATLAQTNAELIHACHTSRQEAFDEHESARQQLVVIDQQLPLLQRWETLKLQHEKLSEELTVLRPQWQQGQHELQRRVVLQKRLKPSVQQCETLRARLPQQETHSISCDRQLQDALRQAELLQQWIRRLALSSQLYQLNDLEAQLLKLDEQLKILPSLDARAVDQLRQLEREEQTAAIALASLVTTLEVLSDGGGLWMDGEQLPEAKPLRLERPVQVSSADGSIALKITPGGGDGVNAARSRLEASREALVNALNRIGVRDVQHAINSERERSQLLSEHRHLIQQSSQINRQALTSQLSVLPELPLDEEHDAEALRARLDSLVPEGRLLRQQLNEAESSLRTTRSELARLEQDLVSDRSALLQADTLLEDLQRRHGGLDVLGQRIGSLERELQHLDVQRDELTPQMSRLNLSESRTPPLAALQQRRELLLQQLAASGARLEVDGQVDLAAQLEEALSEVEYCDSEVLRLQRDSQMIALLQQLFEEQQSALAERYTGPLADALEGYLKLLDLQHERIGLQFDSRKGFSELSWQRKGGLAWSFADLSGGTRELLACALRLAIAEVLAPAYDGCLPVLFDDAFTNVDPSRWIGLSGMLQRAVDQGLQVLFLSCDPQLIDALNPERIHQL